MSGWNKKLEGLEFNLEETIHSLEFGTSQEAWEKLNESFLRLDPVLFNKGSIANAGVAASYNVFIKIRKAWIDPDFDYGRYFNYTESKWTTLLNNYVDFNQLDLLKSQVKLRKSSNQQNYNISYLFNNSHNNGKQCLLAATFSKRFTEDIPVVTLYIRVSEITKRLPFDLLLIQRISEYLYGKDITVSLNIFASQMYGNIETLLMYSSYKPLKKILKGIPKDNPWRVRVSEVYNKFKDGTPEQFSSFKVYLRSFKVLRPDLYTYKPLLAKDLRIEEDFIEYPPECITFSQRKAYKKKLDKQLQAKKK